jgi:3-phenylpropionate/cinnamic acid dioxygenase small subunit
MQATTGDTVWSHARRCLHQDIPGTFLPVSAVVYSQIQQFVHYEALLLDHRQFDRWQKLLAHDFTYSVHALEAAVADSPASARRSGNRQSVLENLVRLQHVPNSTRVRTAGPIRRLILNVSVSFAQCRDEFVVVSYLRIVGAGSEGAPFDLNAQRWDYVRVINRSFQIARREILLHESAVEPPGMVDFP